MAKKKAKQIPKKARNRKPSSASFLAMTTPPEPLPARTELGILIDFSFVRSFTAEVTGGLKVVMTAMRPGVFRLTGLSP